MGLNAKESNNPIKKKKKKKNKNQIGQINENNIC